MPWSSQRISVLGLRRKWVCDDCGFLAFNLILYPRLLQAYAPKFKITDEVTGISTAWTLPYSLRAVGGGSNYDTIEEFSLATQSEINQNSSSSVQNLIWTTGEPASTDYPLMINGSTIRYCKLFFGQKIVF